MTNSDNAFDEKQLEAQLDKLRSIGSGNSARRVLEGVVSRTEQQKRQIIALLAGAGVSAMAALHFILKGDDPFGYIALIMTTFVFLYAARESAKNAEQLASIHSGSSLIASWKEDLEKQLKQTIMTQFVTFQFMLMTAWVVWHVGALSLKSMIFLLTLFGISIFSFYQIWVVRPALKRELSMLNDDD